ncbi:hypothetical protein RI367_007546 [Sorochytrium milnesiophthora]
MPPPSKPTAEALSAWANGRTESALPQLDYALVADVVKNWSTVVSTSTSQEVDSKINSAVETLLHASIAQFLSLSNHPGLSREDYNHASVLARFLGLVVSSGDVPAFRRLSLSLVPISSWASFSHPQKIQSVLDSQPVLKKLWKHALRKLSSTTGLEQQLLQGEKNFVGALSRLLVRAIGELAVEGGDNDNHPAALLAMCLLDLIVGLESQLSTRRFFHAALIDQNVLVLCEQSPVVQAYHAGKSLPKSCSQTAQMLELVKYYVHFAVDEQTGKAVTDEEQAERHEKRVAAFQLERFSDQQLQTLCDIVQVRSLHADGATYGRPLLISTLVSYFARAPSAVEQMSDLSLYPTEKQLFDSPVVQTEGTGDGYPLAIPRLGLQYLAPQDYLHRNFVLCQHEAAFEIAQDVQDAVGRLAPRWDYNLNVLAYSGWARMAMPLEQFTITEVGKKSALGNAPSFVAGEAVFNLQDYSTDVREEWDALAPSETLFLVSVAILPVEKKAQSGKSYSVRYVRGCEVRAVLGYDGNSLGHNRSHDLSIISDPRKRHARILKVHVDPAQYQADTQRLHAEHGDDVYATFNILVRRKPQENTFRAVLQTMRSLAADDASLPAWMQTVFLGYGDPASVTHQQIAAEDDQTIDFHNTFADVQHIRDSFPGQSVVVSESDAGTGAHTTIQFARKESSPSTKRKPTVNQGSTVQEDVLVRMRRAQWYSPQAPVRFTQRQVEAIRAGCSHSLTLVVGPPGTGKSDVAAQIVSNLYHSFPKQRVLLLAHSNQALNELFDKIARLDVNPLHLLRLGQGEQASGAGGASFSKHGRVQSFKERRQQHLARVALLAQSMSVIGEHARDCETASRFYAYHVCSRWQEFDQQVQQLGNANDQDRLAEYVRSSFPFLAFFGGEQTLFSMEAGTEQLVEAANAAWRSLQQLFEDIEQLRIFETLRSDTAKSDYLLTHEARIVAMTCTYASLKRHDLIKSGFSYDTLVMEEAAQVLDVETFIPMTLQGKSRASTLKRIVLLGDHHQLPPIVQNRTFAQYANMDQSFFARMIRLGVPYIQLDKQGRARKEIADLYTWRYPGLGHLPSIDTNPEYQNANAGFAHVCQLVNVDDYNGQGESAPAPHFYQNLGEAEYVVAVYQYMRLLGYPAASIAILTTYNGQRALIADVLSRRCESNPLFGNPGALATVDRFQGQQADCHLSDVRRLIVALSRARLGLYVFARERLFDKEPTLQNALKGLKSSSSLRLANQAAERVVEVKDVLQMGQLVYDMTKKLASQQSDGFEDVDMTDA